MPIKMPWKETDTAPFADIALLIARILLAWIFIRAGYAKVTDLGAFGAGLARDGVPLPQVVGFIAAFVEFLGGIALLIGFQIRYTALLMVLFVIIATLLRHRYWEFADAAQRRAQDGNFYKNLAIIGGLLALYVAGAGSFAADRYLKRK